VIVLPDFLQTEPISVRRNVLRHELAHLSTQHPLQLFLQRLCTFLFWYHPLVWWAGHKAALGREFLCDEMAAGHSAEQLSGYLRTLLSLVERHAKLSHSVLGFRRHRGTLALRTAYLVRCCEQRPTPRSDRHVLAAITCVFGVCALIISQFWVSFNVLASQEAGWSPWPTWSAEVLHDFGIHARDFEEFKRSRELYRIFPTHHTQSS
jgi:beta-lactamase regulating signal transducer with metallopeptidase domain